MAIKLDFSKDTEFPQLPAGEYEAVLTNCEVKIGKNSGNPYLNYEFTINGGEHDNAKMWSTNSLTANSVFALRRTLIAIGIDEKELKKLVDFDVDNDAEKLAEQLVGANVMLEVVHEEYEGSPRAQVKKIKRSVYTKPRALSFAAAPVVPTGRRRR